MKDGLCSQCRDCKKKTDAKYRKEKPEVVARSKAKWYQDNKEYCNERSKKTQHARQVRRPKLVVTHSGCWERRGGGVACGERRSLGLPVGS